jgi:hypothetical protein
LKGRQRFETQAQGGRCAELEGRIRKSGFEQNAQAVCSEQSNKTSRKSWERLVYVCRYKMFISFGPVAQKLVSSKHKDCKSTKIRAASRLRSNSAGVLPPSLGCGPASQVSTPRRCEENQCFRNVVNGLPSHVPPHKRMP